MTRAAAVVAGRLGLYRGTLARKLVLQSAGSLSLNGAAFVLNLVMAIVLSHLIGPDGYGAYSFAVAWATLLAVPALLGLPQLVVRELSGYRVREDWERVRGLIRRVNEAAIVAATAVAVLGATVLTLIGWPKPPLFAPTIVGLALIPLITVISLRQGAMLGFGVVLWARAPGTLVAPLVTIGLVGVFTVTLAGGLTATWVVGAQVLGAVTAVVWGTYLLRRTLPQQAKTAKPRYENRLWLRGAMPFLLTGLISSINFQSGTILTGAIAGSHAAGVYGVAAKISGFLPFLSLAVVPVLMPKVAELYARREVGRLQEVLTRATRLIFLASFPAALFVIVFAGPILAVFGQGFGSGSTALRIMCLGQLVSLSMGFAIGALAMTNAAGETTKAAASAAVLNLVLGVALIPSFGATGAAIASAASVALTNVLAAYLLWRRRRIFSPAFGERVAA